jgi:isoleucyl-tRNA synthetase
MLQLLVAIFYILITISNKHLNQLFYKTNLSQEQFYRAKYKLDLKKKKLYSLLEQVPIGIFYYDNYLKILTYNRIFYEIFGLETNLKGFDLNNLEDKKAVEVIKGVIKNRNTKKYIGSYNFTFQEKTLWAEMTCTAVVDDNGLKLPKNTYLVIWTTTPWTLPANVAVAVNPDLTYVLLSGEDANYIVAKDLYREFLEKTGLKLEPTREFVGKELEGIKYRHPFIDRIGTVVLADYVASDTGTGMVHIAPGHGEEDYEVSLKYNLPVLVPVDDNGRFTDDVPSWLSGVSIWKGNELIIDKLKELGALLFSEEIIHSYPHCWRCKKPVIFRATPQWFISLDSGNPSLRSVAVSEIEEVKWIPEWGEIRIKNMVETRPDWCISRQRYWGVPIVAFYCKDCGSYIMSREIAEHVAEIFESESADAWYLKTPQELLPEGFKCPFCQGTNFQKEMDILDVWFDSGSSHAAVLERRKELKWPADMYLEGSDQHRGWFQASFLSPVEQGEEHLLERF